MLAEHLAENANRIHTDSLSPPVYTRAREAFADCFIMACDIFNSQEHGIVQPYSTVVVLNKAEPYRKRNRF